MVEIKIDEMHLERQIKIRQRAFHVFLIHAQRGEILVIHL